MSLLTTPVIQHSLEEMRRRMSVFSMYRTEGELDLAPAYQRESVWSEAKQQAAWYSWLSGVSIGAIYLNLREDDPQTYHVVDGKQRIEAYFAFVDGDLLLPSLWFAPRKTGSGMSLECPADAPEMVSFADLTDNGRSYAKSQPSCLYVESQLATEADEALLFGLINSGGVIQTHDTLAHAAKIAGGKATLQVNDPRKA